MITIAHSEHSSGELKQTGIKLHEEYPLSIY